MSRPEAPALPRHVQQLLKATWNEADRRPPSSQRQEAVTTALGELDEQVRLDPAADRTIALLLKVRDLLLLERLAAEAHRSSVSVAASAAARLRSRLDYDPEEVRAWAAANGHRAPRRGRYLPGALLDAYRKAQRCSDDATAAPEPGGASAPSSSPETATGARSRPRRPAGRASSQPSSAGTSSPTPSAAPTTSTTSAPSASGTASAAAASSDNS